MISLQLESLSMVIEGLVYEYLLPEVVESAVGLVPSQDRIVGILSAQILLLVLILNLVEVVLTVVAVLLLMLVARLMRLISHPMQYQLMPTSAPQPGREIAANVSLHRPGPRQFHVAAPTFRILRTSPKTLLYMQPLSR